MATIAEEMESLQAKGTWADVDVATCPPLPTHPVLQIKRTVNGEFERCKTRIVAGGDHQEYGVNCTDTYALFLYLSCVFSWEKVQVDVKTAFLYGELDEEMYVRTPGRIAGGPSRMKRLSKAMYGLKQAHKVWHTKISGDLIRMGCSELKSVSCVYIKWFGTGVFVLVLVYEDGFLMISPSGVQLEEVYQAIASLYEIRRMKEVNLYLGVELRWSKRLGGSMMLHMLQPAYIKSMLVRYGMQDSRPASAPMLQSFFAHLEAEEDTTVVELKLYQQVIGSLLYLALKTRPDILTAVCILSRFTGPPTKYCHVAVKRVFRYLQGTIYLAMSIAAAILR
jgi:Reverse transcriptase (RNA-dependent DNA polymerase)